MYGFLTLPIILILKWMWQFPKGKYILKILGAIMALTFFIELWMEAYSDQNVKYIISLSVISTLSSVIALGIMIYKQQKYTNTILLAMLNYQAQQEKFWEENSQ